MSPGYFATLGIPLLRGRTFSADEARAGEAVVVVSEATARQLWPNGDAVGADGETVVAVRDERVGDADGARYRCRREMPSPDSLASGAITRPFTSRGASTAISRAARWSRRGCRAAWPDRRYSDALTSIDPGGSVELHTLDESVSVQVYPFRAAHWVASALGVIALLLTVTGIYGVLAYIVALREKEIGIRARTRRDSADDRGAGRAPVDAARGDGRGGGSLIALGASRFIASRLTMIPAFDAVALAAGAAIVLLAALAAAYVPSRTSGECRPGGEL